MYCATGAGRRGDVPSPHRVAVSNGMKPNCAKGPRTALLPSVHQHPFPRTSVRRIWGRELPCRPVMSVAIGQHNRRRHIEDKIENADGDALELDLDLPASAGTCPCTAVPLRCGSNNNNERGKHAGRTRRIDFRLRASAVSARTRMTRSRQASTVLRNLEPRNSKNRWPRLTSPAGPGPATQSMSGAVDP